MDTLDLDQLRTLATIARQQSFAAAAVQLGCTQSAITQQMQRLEDKVGHTLFEKQGRQKRLTEHGQRLLGYAQRMLAIHDEAISSLRHHHLEGLVRIGAPHDVADTMLPPVLKEIALKFPGVQIDIHMERSPFLMESLKQGELDLVISNRDDTTFESFALRSSPTVWLCGANYVHDPGKPVPLVLASGPSIFRRLACDALDAADIGWTPRHTCTSLVGIRAALRADLGVTARGVEQLDPGLRVLGSGDGMPPLPDLVYKLYIRSHVVNPITRQVFENLKARMWLPGA
ncbi:LysR substrate-binding domain-containing protein [Comamonas testosteroni]|jgi:DNA-binding transcriptional LysR family regulator|uniref:Transcriptional regulator, LysR family n=2 Tax=Comamonas testosteroni TaxID=285 RepID=B7X2U8_COMTK|nr:MULTISPECIES: LysR substrate-binding domain-containing protein [Comamonas]AIJ46048.1 transcriptional regulator [Comamonas testosteroni TK102]EED68501.1 transcriptional regulator, LysR family [Comamonas testosteroni KF-1]MPS88733.1 transcriptional regulator LrhA [Comamonas sp.]WQG66528.1 LysR substrate-binding domain-containing protein [Comamonas testosteroni]